MKTILFSMLAAAVAALGFIPTPAPAANVSVSVFYDALEPHGEWVQTPEYGHIWHPRGVDQDWRPYTVGSWAYTDAGWTWVSEEPFGWATYHYGRWVDVDEVGWAWVPGREWAPAWVSWRRGGDHIGWAPLPPEADFQVNVGFRDWVDSYYDIGPTNYSFVRVRDFGAPRIRTVIVQPRENITIIRETRNITNITYVNNVVFNDGPQYDVIVRETAQPIRRLRIERDTEFDFRDGGRDGRRDRYAARVNGDTLRVIAPTVEVSREVAPSKVARRLDRVEVDRGWKKAGNAEVVRDVRARFAEQKAPAELPAAPALRGSDENARRDAQQAAAKKGDAPDRNARTSEAPAPGRPAGETAATAPVDGSKPATPMSRDGAEKPAEKAPATAATERNPAAPTASPEAEKAVTEKKATARANAEKAEREQSRKSDTERKGTASTPERSSQPAASTEQPPAPATAPESTEKRTAREEQKTREQKKDRSPDATSASREAQPEPNRSRQERLRENQPDPTATGRGSEGEAMKKQQRATETKEPNRESPESAERPSRNQRPEAAERPERSERSERQANPAAVEEMRKAQPQQREERSAERQRPESVQRSPESRGASPEAGPPGGNPRGGEKQGGEDRKKKE